MLSRRARIRLVLAFLLVLASNLPARAQSARHDWSTAQRIAGAVHYATLSIDSPRKLSIHCIQIDATDPRVHFHTTGRATNWEENVTETIRQSTRDFVRESRAAGLNMVAAINADVFKPWPAPYDQRSPADLGGFTVSQGVLVSPPGDGPSFVVYRDRRVAIEAIPPDLAEIHTAISGYKLVLQDGQALIDRTDLHPRTGIGVDRDARYVYLLVIDGRRHASIGATTEEVARWLLYFGAHNGMNLDGGGSATMVRFDAAAPDDGVILLNQPVGDGTVWTKFPETHESESYRPTERANGNNLGVIVAAE